MKDEDDDDDGDDDADGDDDDVKRGGEEGEGWRCPKKNKNPTLRMWGIRNEKKRKVKKRK